MGDAQAMSASMTLRRRNKPRQQQQQLQQEQPSSPPPPSSSPCRSLSRPTLLTRNDKWSLYTRMAFSTATILARSSVAAAQPEAGSGRELGRYANIVDLVICLASIIGSLIIIFPYVMSKNSRKLRHSLILGLAVSDLISSLIIVITTGYLLNGGNLIEARRFCTFLGFALSMAIYMQHFWNLFILIVTYMILVYPLSSFTLALERRIIWLWPINLVASMAINGVAWGVAGFSYSNGYCYYGPGGGLIFSSLMQLVPRVVVVLVIVILYTQLFFFLRRTNLMNATSSKVGSAVPTHEMLSLPNLNLRNSDENSNSKGTTDGSNSNKTGGDDMSGASNKSETARDGSNSMRAAKTYLPFLNTSATHNRDAAAPSTTSNTPAPGRSPTSAAFPGSRKPSNASMGMGGDDVSPNAQTADAAMQPSSGRYLGTYPPERPPLVGRRSRSLSDLGPSFELTRTASSSGRDVNGSNAMLSPDDSMTQMKRPLLLSESSTTIQQQHQHQQQGGRSSSESSNDSVPDYHTWAGLAPMRPRKDTRDFEMISPPREHLRHFSLRVSDGGVGPLDGSSRPTRPQTAPNQRPMDEDVERQLGPRRDSLSLDLDSTLATPSQRQQQHAYEEGLDENWTWGMNVTSSDAQAGMTRIQTIGGGSVAVPADDHHLHHHSHPLPPQSRRGSAAVAQSTHRGGGLIASRHTGESSHEHGVEDLGSTLNRQASALLLLYPLAYVILFSISLIRLIRDLADPGNRQLRSTDPLANISRWLIFAQGLLDCIIFKVIERQFRLRLKRKRARARGEDPGKTGSQKVWWWMKWSGRWLLRKEQPVEKPAVDSRRPSLV